MKKKILYIEDMPKCYEKTKEILGEKYNLDWRKTSDEAIDAIKNHLKDYDVIISDVNLTYIPGIPNFDQTKEGLSLIKLAREECKKNKHKIPIFCVSSNGTNKKPSLKNGANIFMWKKSFWEGKGEKYLDKILKSKSLNSK